MTSSDGRNRNARNHNTSGAQQGEPLRIIPKVGERRDEANVLRSFTDPAGTLVRGTSARAAIEGFLAARAADLKSADVDLREVDASQGAAILRIRYQQFHHNIPVRGTTLQAVADVRHASLIQVDNAADFDLGDAPQPMEARPLADLTATALQPFLSNYEHAHITGDELVYVRDAGRPALPDSDYPTATVALLGTGTTPDGAVHLVRDLRVETTGPFEVFRVQIDAVDGALMSIELASKYVTANLQVFSPDPVSESNDGTLSGASTAATLNAFRHAVQAEVNPATAGVFRLEGAWARAVDWDPPTFAQPAEASANFSYQTYPADRRFLSANAYFWLDTAARYLRTLGNATLNANMTRVDIDAQGFSGQDNSQWFDASGATPARIRMGEGGAPDAGDFGVIVHEYTHGVFGWLGADHGGSVSYEHSFCDAFPAIFRDRFNANRNRRTETFPFDNNATNRWSTERTLDRAERFTDAGFAGYGVNLRNSMLGTAVWDCYIGMGGDSPEPAVRVRAADALIRTMMEMLLIVPDDTSPDVAHAQSLARGLITADSALTGGLYGKVMDEAFIDRGLWARRAVDLFITDSSADSGEIPSPVPHWTSPDIWVRNVDIGAGDDPELGHQNPIVNQPNYMYVRVRNRGSAAAAPGTFSLESFHCDPGTGMIWPTHFQSLGTLVITDPVPPGGAVRVGPFVWTPTVVDHECLLAIVTGVDDPSITATLTAPVPHDQIVRFDNNVGQRNVSPQLSVPGGKSKVTLTLHGGLTASTNAWQLDATALPADSSITVRTLRRIVQPDRLTDFRVREQGVVRTTLEMAGGTIGLIDGFRLTANDRVSVDIVIDFSREAEHLRVYPVVATQLQDGVIVGRLTVSLTAVKELEDYFFGNPRSHELHISSCPFWSQLGSGSKVPFEHLEDAVRRGYNGCAFCLSSADTD